MTVPTKVAETRPRILIAEPLGFSSRAKALLCEVGDVTLHATDAAALPSAFREYDVVWIRLASRITAAMLGEPPRCRVLVVPATGLDHVDLDACRRRGIRVVSLYGETDFLKSVRATAEMTLALTLALLRKIPQAAADVSAGHWERDKFRGNEIFERTVGLVGVGRLGTIAASYFRALGATVIGYDPRPDFPHDAARRVERLSDLLSESDIVCIMARYDAGTQRLIGRSAFAAMKPGAVLVNTSRGGIIDEPSLIDALESGRLSGAALDVLDGEPDVTFDHPVVRYAREHSNLLVVPHLGGNTTESLEKTEFFLAQKLAAILREA
jgi:D-3-phosphoglycerate dehydrogenase